MIELFAFPLIVAILFFSIIVHEYSHGFIASLLGDPTPKISGRLTFNPCAHIDLFGTIILPVTLLIITTQMGYPFAFGYAKPILINPAKFSNPRKGIMWVGIAGPLSNFILALILSILHWLPFPSFLQELFEFGIIINVILGIFNLIPLPPLDGSRIVLAFLPYEYAYHYTKLERFGFIIILVLFMTRILHWLILPLAGVLLSLLGVNTQVY